MGVRQFKSKRLGRDVWGYDARIRGVRVKRTGFSTKKAAELALANARVRANERAAGVVVDREPEPTVTVRQLVERRAAQLQGTPRRRTSARLLERWLETLPAGLLVTDVTTARLQEWVDARLSEVRYETVFREVTDICSTLNRAGENFAELEGWTPPRRPRMPAPTRRRERVITPEEAAAVLAHLRRPIEEGETETYWRVRRDAADLFQIALLTAARRAEILALRWTDVNFEWKTLRVTGTKTDRVRVIPMAESLVALLRRRRVECGGAARVFPSLEGSTMLRANTDQIFRRACEEISVPYGRDVPGGWVLHDARHTAITAMLHAGNSLESVMAISGHSARVMAMRYAHSTERTRREAVSALDQFASEKVSALVSTSAQDAQHMQQVRDGAGEEKGGKIGANQKTAGKRRA